MRSIHELPSRIWPLGTDSLRSVAIYDKDGRGVTPVHLGFLVLLPNLATIYVQGLSTTSQQDLDDFEGLFDQRIPPRSLSVRNIFLESARSASTHLILQRLLASIACLHTLILKDCELRQLGHNVNSLGEEHASTLETLIICGNASRIGDGHHPMCRMRQFQNATALRVLSIDILDIIPASARRSVIEENHRDEIESGFIERFSDLLPQTLEVLILQKTPSQRLNDGEMHKVDRALTYVIESKRCPSLKALYLDSFEAGMRDARCQWGQWTAGGWLENVRASGRLYDVQVYTQVDEGATAQYVNSIFRNSFEYGH